MEMSLRMRSSSSTFVPNSITLDEKTAVEEKSISQILVAAGSFRGFRQLHGRHKALWPTLKSTQSKNLIMDVYDANLSGESKEA